MTTLQHQVIDPHIHMECNNKSITECHCRVAVAVDGLVRIFECFTFEYVPVGDATLQLIADSVEQAKQSVNYIMQEQVGRGIL